MANSRSCALATVVFLKLDTILLSNKSVRPEGRAKREPLLFNNIIVSNLDQHIVGQVTRLTAVRWRSQRGLCSISPEPILKS